MATTSDQAGFFDLQIESPSSSCSSSPPTSLKPVDSQNEIDSGCGSDDDPALALKINKGLSMGYDYELIKSVIQQQNDGDDMSKFIETIVRTAEVNSNSNIISTNNNNNNNNNSPSSKSCSPTTINQKADMDLSSMNSNCSETTMPIPHDIYIIDGADLAYSFGNNVFSWRGIEICIKYLHSHGHKKVFVALPYSLKHHRHDQSFSESKSLRDLERKNMLVYTNRMSKQTNKPGSYTHISEMLKFSQKTKGHLITNVSLKDVILDFTIYKHIIEEKVIRYRFQNDNFQPLLVTIVSGDDGNDCETHYPLCPYGKKCTYGSKCKYFHIERRYQNPLSITESLQMKARLEKSKLQHQSSNPPMIPVLANNGFKSAFNQTKSGPDHIHMYNDRHSPIPFYPTMEQTLIDDARAAYEYGLSSTSPMSTSNDFSFVDQRLPMQQQQQQQTRQTQIPTHHSWFGTPNQQQSAFNRTFSMPQQQQQTNLFSNNDSQRLMEEQQQMAATMLIHQQNWARQQQQQQQQQMFSMQQQQQPQQFEQNVLRLLSMLSFQQQNNMMNNHNQHLSSVNTMMPSMTSQSSQQQQQQQQQQESPYDRSSMNSQQYLADKIQAVRHLWESESQYASSSSHSQQMQNYNLQPASPMVDSTLFSPMNTSFQQGTHGFIQFQ
ncbi:unnamed protein product [Rotaria socialis]|uniref:C3H1-type domain-containing protein n=1 Tax=Rotaria socialis TaxID=392032 RepID=A0A817QUJ8_9BILA|nr:unnamed protein product [Rotaria socialis]CAF4222890.1 unnamed protein product [Rotaria socialis]